MDFFYSLLLLTFATVLATLFLSKIWVNKTKSAANGEPPELPGNWPVIGHLHLLMGGGKPSHRLLAELAERYGPVFTLRFGMKPTVVVSSWELARDCFTTNDSALASRPASLAMKLMAYDGAMFATTPYGPYWREIRKLATLELLSARRLEMLKHVRALEVDLFVREMFDRWVGNGRDPVKIDMKQQLEDVTFNVTMQMVAGKRYFGRDVPEAEVEMARRYRVLAKETFRIVGISGFYDSLPFLEWFDFLGHVRNMKRVAKEMDLIVGGWIQEHRRKAESERPRDFIDVLLSTVTEGDLTAVYDSDTVIKATALQAPDPDRRAALLKAKAAITAELSQLLPQNEDDCFGISFSGGSTDKDKKEIDIKRDSDSDSFEVDHGDHKSKIKSTRSGRKLQKKNFKDESD